MKRWSIIIIAAVGLAAYSNTFDVPFQFDDFFSIADNPVIRDTDNFLATTRGYEYNPRRVIGYLSFALNYGSGGLDVRGYHAANLAIHIINALLVYLMVLLTFKTPYGNTKGNGRWAMGRTEDKAQAKITPPSPPLAKGGIGGVVQEPLTSHLMSPHGIALVAALLFVSHPVQTQAVTYIVQRFTSLATMFSLLSVVLYIKGRIGAMGYGRRVTPLTPPLERGELKGGVSRLLPFVWFFLSFISAICAMKTKEIAFTLPFMIILYEFTFFKTPLKKKLIILVPALLLLLIIPLSIVGTNMPLGEILSDLSEQTRVQTEVSRWDYLFTQMRVITTYLRLLLLPVNLNLDYDYRISGTFLEPGVMGGFVLILLLSGLGVYLIYKSGRRAESTMQSEGDGVQAYPPASPLDKGGMEGGSFAICPLPFTFFYRLIGFGILWFFLALSVESSFIPIADVIFEHRLYLPSAGAFIAVTAAAFLPADRFARTFPPWNTIVLLFLAFTTVLMATCTFARNSVWSDEVVLWQDVVKKSPHKARPHHNLGVVYNSRGFHDLAIEKLRKALALKPDYRQAYNNIGVAYLSKGMPLQAMANLRVALAFRHDFPEAHTNIGLALREMGRTDDAMASFRTALAYDRDNPLAHNNLGVMYGVKGMTGPAIGHFREALKARPDDAGIHNNIGIALQAEGRVSEAIGHYRTALRLAPDFEEARTNLGLALKSYGLGPE